MSDATTSNFEENSTQQILKENNEMAVTQLKLINEYYQPQITASFDATIKFGTSVLRGCFILNGAAMVSMLTFFGTTINAHLPIINMTYSFWCFIVGIIFSLFATGASWWFQNRITFHIGHARNDESEKVYQTFFSRFLPKKATDANAQTSKQPSRINPQITKYVILGFAISFVVASLFFFGVGCYFFQSNFQLPNSPQESLTINHVSQNPTSVTIIPSATTPQSNLKSDSNPKESLSIERSSQTPATLTITPSPQAK